MRSAIATKGHRVRRSVPGPVTAAASQPQIALLLSTYRKPRHLERVLTSIAMQQRVAGRFELVVTDDGSTDDTLDVVDRFESVKVIYLKKRVKLIFEKREDGDDEYVVRYTDHTLNPLQRKAFEDYMRATHEIPVLSTEKRFKG